MAQMKRNARGAVGCAHGGGPAGSLEQSTRMPVAVRLLRSSPGDLPGHLVSMQLSAAVGPVPVKQGSTARLCCAAIWLRLLHLSAPASRDSSVPQLGRLLGRPVLLLLFWCFTGSSSPFDAGLRDPAPSSLRLLPHAAAPAAPLAKLTAPGAAACPWRSVGACPLCMGSTLTSVVCVARCAGQMTRVRAARWLGGRTGPSCSRGADHGWPWGALWPEQGPQPAPGRPRAPPARKARRRVWRGY